MAKLTQKLKALIFDEKPDEVVVEKLSADTALDYFDMVIQRHLNYYRFGVSEIDGMKVKYTRMRIALINYLTIMDCWTNHFKFEYNRQSEMREDLAKAYKQGKEAGEATDKQFKGFYTNVSDTEYTMYQTLWDRIIYHVDPRCYQAKLSSPIYVGYRNGKIFESGPNPEEDVKV